MTNRGSALSNLNLISARSVVFATLTKSDASLQKPLREIMQLRSHFELVSFPLTGRKLIEVVIKAGGESLESSWERRFLAVKSLIQWEYPSHRKSGFRAALPSDVPFFNAAPRFHINLMRNVPVLVRVFHCKFEGGAVKDAVTRDRIN